MPRSNSFHSAQQTSSSLSHSPASPSRARTTHTQSSSLVGRGVCLTALADRRKPGGLVAIGGRSSQINRRSDQITKSTAGGREAVRWRTDRRLGTRGRRAAGGVSLGAAGVEHRPQGAWQAGSSEGLKGAARQHASGQQGGTGQVGCSSQRQQQQETGNRIPPLWKLQSLFRS